MAVSQPKHRTQIPLFDALDGARVRIRPFQVADAGAHFAAIEESRERIGRWLPWVPAYESVDDSRDTLARMRARWLLREDFDMGLFDRQSGALLGGIGFHPRNWASGYFEIGYWLRTSAEGQGYVTEAVRLLTDHLFASLDAHRVEICCDACNARSAAVAERAGFIREARLRNARRGADGVLSDTLVFALTDLDDHTSPHP
ncbi:MAG: GNAT family N-acetyltransferase [Ktedonobacterales bacterium]